jgi:hypothetical protein
MSRFFQELNICPFLKPEAEQMIIDAKRRSKYRRYLFASTDVRTFLRKEMISLFEEMKIFPESLLAFGHINDTNFEALQIVHSDVIYNDSRWKRVPFAFNWELEDVNSSYTWWDTQDLKECFPEEIVNQTVAYYGGAVHYGKRTTIGDTVNLTSKEMKDIKSRMIKLETYNLKKLKPVLINTIVPHSVFYKTDAEHRTLISLRFSLDQIPSWEAALEIFKPFYEK